mgnify:CR=1 FL=1
MKRLLQEEYEPFVRSYRERRWAGLRVNTLKISADRFRKISPFALEPIPWTESGFYYEEEERPGRHPYHDAGLYYIQEPSAMAVGEFTDAEPGERVLDLCAAPGGKSTHLAAKMKGSGLLVANEIHPARARILSQNIERMGIRNAVVTNESPDRLAERFAGYFDRVLVDAPCSGEGMFRKDPETCAEWSPESAAACAVRQLDILQHAARMVRVGGRLVYSTCTFNPEENEQVIGTFLLRYAEFELEAPPRCKGFDPGRPDWAGEAGARSGLNGAGASLPQAITAALARTIRIWPHRVRGEGHFIAVLRRTDGDDTPERRRSAETITDRSALKPFRQFAEEALLCRPDGRFLFFGDQLYCIPSEMVSLRGLKVLRPGWHLGEIRKGRFEPSHALALSLHDSEVKLRRSLPADSPELAAYLRGETLAADGPNGWTLVEADGFGIGWGKQTGQVLKNHYPKGLRRTARF